MCVYAHIKFIGAVRSFMRSLCCRINAHKIFMRVYATFGRHPLRKKKVPIVSLSYPHVYDIRAWVYVYAMSHVVLVPVVQTPSQLSLSRDRGKGGRQEEPLIRIVPVLRKVHHGEEEIYQVFLKRRREEE
jgi:hypothetical protein